MPEDSDSISTFRQAKQPDNIITKKASPPSRSGSRPIASSNSIGTSLTNESYATLDSKILGLTSQMLSNQSKTEKQLQKQQEQFTQILATLQTLTQSNNNTSSKEASSPKTGNEQ